MTLFTVSQTYQTVTPESAANGDFADSGYCYKDHPLNLRDVLHAIERQGVDHIEDRGDRLDIYGHSHITDFRTGEEEWTCLHITGSARSINRLVRLLKANH